MTVKHWMPGIAVCGMLLTFAAGAEVPAAQSRGGEVLPDFSPPPVPAFMLNKPQRPLTLEEMQRQADAAAQRARAERVPVGTPTPDAGAPARIEAPIR